MNNMYAATSVILLGLLRLSICEYPSASYLARKDGLCGHQKDGVYANHSSSCQKYFRCLNLQVVERLTCREGEAFSSVSLQCLPSDQVSCVDIHCSSNDHGFYAVPGSHCKAYYQCSHGVRTDLVCPTGSVFNFDQQVCVRTGGVCYEPVCTGRVDRYYADTTHKCSRAFQCSGGRLIATFGCSQGRLYNGNICDQNSKVICESPETTAVAFPIASTDRCATLSDGSHPAPDAKCRDYIVCKGGITQGSLRCPVGFRYDGHRCAPADFTPCRDECQEKADGYYADVSSGCREYFYCSNRGSVSRDTCPESTVFNGHMCVPAPLYTCPSVKYINPCARKTDGHHRDYSSCRSYLICQNGNTIHRGTCQKDQVWNGTFCVKSNEFYCKGPEHFSGCDLVDPGLYQDRSASSACQKYYHCSGGNRTLFSCPKGELFDGESCVSSNSYTCPSLEPDSCDHKDDGYYQDSSSSCRGYYYCSNGHKITYVCPDGHVFNGTECVGVQTYHCPFITEDCKGKPEGYHMDIKSKCRNYYYCLNGDKLTTLTCSGSKIFNGERCTKSLDFVCPEERGSHCALCSSRSDGYYPDLSSGCTKYFSCMKKKLFAQYTCTNGQVYDGQYSCVPKNCTHENNNCAKDGFFTDFNTNCRSYFFCIDGNKTQLSCPENQVFNGQVCVNKNAYPCQSECDRRRIRNGCDNNI